MIGSQRDPSGGDDLFVRRFGPNGGSSWSITLAPDIRHLTGSGIRAVPDGFLITGWSWDRNGSLVGRVWRFASWAP